jgi:hypothetical protein
LRVIATHYNLKFDKNLFMFLTLPDFDNFKSNPSAYEKLMGVKDYMFSFKNLSVNGVRSAV